MRTLILLLLFLDSLAAQKSSLFGLITDAVSHQPLEGAHIRIGPRDTALTATSDVNGAYRIADVPPGRTFVEITKDGYAKLGVLENSAECVFEVNAGDAMRRSFALQPVASVQGRLLDHDTGKPIEGLRVSALREDYGVGVKRFVPLAMSKASSSDGAFALTGLNAGEYILEIRQAKLPKVTAEAGKNEETAATYSTSYFPGVPRLDMAAPLLLGIGETRTLEIQLRQGGLRTVSGRFEMQGDAAKIQVMAVKDDHQSFTMIAEGKIDAPGPFRVVNLSEGKFTLLAFTDGEETGQFLEYPIEMGNRDIEGLTLTLLPAFTVQGLVLAAKDEGDPPIAKMTFRLQPLTRISMPGEHVETPVTAAGEFVRTGVVAGNYFPVLSHIPEGWAVAEVTYQGAVTPYGAALVVDGRSIDGTIKFALTKKLGSVTGAVRDSNGNPASGVKVVLIPQPLPERYSPANYRIQMGDPQGNFRFDRLPPGKYKAIPLTGKNVRSDNDADIIRQKSVLLDAFEVQAGQAVSITIKP